MASIKKIEGIGWRQGMGRKGTGVKRGNRMKEERELQGEK